jgi:hypothetical protein
MQRRPLIALLLLSLFSVAWAEVEMAPLLALRMARKGFENMIWMDQRVKIGKESVTGYIQGTGGGDDALMGFELEEDWDLLEATVGYLATTPEGRTAEFTVEAGGEILYNSGPLDSKRGASKIRVPLKGNKRITLRISSERYNGTAGAAFGAPTLFRGLSAADLETSWNLRFDGSISPLPGSSAPREVMVPLPVPGEGDGDAATEYIYRVRRDAEARTVIVERLKVEP